MKNIIEILEKIIELHQEEYSLEKDEKIKILKWVLDRDLK